MTHSTTFAGRETEIATLFKTTFTASEGAEEGAMIGDLSANLMAQTAPEDLFVCLAQGDAALDGTIIFSRLTYPEDPISLFVLGPVAVAPDRQGQGVGQALLRYGLGVLREAGVAASVTYGDPGYYTRVGYQPISEADVPAPYPLQYPEGWLGQSLSGAPLPTLKGPAHCVSAFANPAYW